MGNILQKKKFFTNASETCQSCLVSDFNHTSCTEECICNQFEVAQKKVSRMLGLDQKNSAGHNSMHKDLINFFDLDFPSTKLGRRLDDAHKDKLVAGRGFGIEKGKNGKAKIKVGAKGVNAKSKFLHPNGATGAKGDKNS